MRKRKIQCLHGFQITLRFLIILGNYCSILRRPVFNGLRSLIHRNKNEKFALGRKTALRTMPCLDTGFVYMPHLHISFTKSDSNATQWYLTNALHAPTLRSWILGCEFEIGKKIVKETVASFACCRANESGLCEGRRIQIKLLFAQKSKVDYLPKEKSSCESPNLNLNCISIFFSFECLPQKYADRCYYG
jgi:hypothetical protein